MRRVCVWCGAALLVVALGHCGKSGDGGGAAKRDPAELGREIGETYLAMMEDAAGAVAAAADPAALGPVVDGLTTKYAERFVALGRQREALGPSDREKCDGVAGTRMRGVAHDHLAAIDAAAAACKETDPALAKRVGDLRRMARYASFEQLRAQLPEEAARLGVR